MPVQYRGLWEGAAEDRQLTRESGNLHLQSAPQGDILSGRCSAAQMAPVSGYGSAAVGRKEGSLSGMLLGSGERGGCK